MQTRRVSHYGVHWTPEGVAFLQQGRSGTNALGLREKSPFVVETPGRLPCNHLINLAATIPDVMQWDYFQSLFPDPLLQAMLPLPKHPGTAGAYFVTDPDGRLSLYLAILARMSSPIQAPVLPIWAEPIPRISVQMAQTNSQPLVLTGGEVKHTTLIGQVGELAATNPRTVVITGTADIPVTRGIIRLKTKIDQFNIVDLTTLPLETMGALMVRRYMRREQLDRPFRDPRS